MNCSNCLVPVQIYWKKRRALLALVKLQRVVSKEDLTKKPAKIYKSSLTGACGESCVELAQETLILHAIEQRLSRYLGALPQDSPVRAEIAEFIKNEYPEVADQLVG